MISEYERTSDRKHRSIYTRLPADRKDYPLETVLFLTNILW